MIQVKITESVYLELIDSSKNQYKFYRLTKLDNGKWLRQNGRIGTAGASEIYAINNSTNGFSTKYNEKINKNYEHATEEFASFIEPALNKFGFQIASLNIPVDDFEMSAKGERNIKKIKEIRQEYFDSVINDTLGQHRYIDKDDREILNQIDEILTKIEFQVEQNLFEDAFPSESVEFMNKIAERLTEKVS